MVEHAFHAKTADKNTAKYAVYKRKKQFFTMFCKKSQNIHYYNVNMQVLQGVAMHKGDPSTTLGMTASLRHPAQKTIHGSPDRAQALRAIPKP